MYLYESHMGGLYTTDERQDFDDLYCEECGDSDFEIGYFADDDAEGVWTTIMPPDLECIGCRDKMDECSFTCPKYNSNSSHSLALIPAMRFIEENVSFEKYSYVYLICEDRKTGEILVNFKPAGHKFGECHTLPHSYCLKKSLEKKVALSLVPFYAFVEEVVEDPKEEKTIQKNNRTIHVYRCIVERDKECGEDTASWYDDGWYGFLDPAEFVPKKGEEFLKEIATEHIS